MKKSMPMSWRAIPNKEEADDFLLWILAEEKKTVLPAYYKNREEEMILMLKDNGINAEVYTTIGFGDFVRRVN